MEANGVEGNDIVEVNDVTTGMQNGHVWCGNNGVMTGMLNGSEWCGRERHCGSE